MNIPKKIFTFVLLIYLFSSCIEKGKDRSILILDKSNSLVTDLRFQLDSLTIEYSDSIYIQRHYTERYFEVCLYQTPEGVFEIRDTYNDLGGEYLGKDTILTLSTKETNFIYKSTIEFISTVWNYTLASCKYEIKKIGNNNYITTKSSLIDSTYKEIYYYNKDYHITKFVNTYQDNICTYILK